MNGSHDSDNEEADSCQGGDSFSVDDDFDGTENVKFDRMEDI